MVKDTRRAGDLEVRARRAAGKLAWEEAFEIFARADEASPLGGEDLETWATAAYLVGRSDRAADLLARAYRIHVDDGGLADAARIGFWIVFLLFEQGELAQARGWLSKCGRLLEQLPAGSVAHGYMLALKAYQQVAVDEDYENGLATAEEAIRIGREVGDHDLQALGLNLKGRSLARKGEIEAGLTALDEAMVEVVSGHLSPVVVGTVYCSLIEACEEVGELPRAQEWTGALARWCDRQNGEVPFTAQCRVHRSKVFQRGGDMKAAEEEAKRAYQEYTRTIHEQATGRALYQVAEVQRLRGRLAEAEDSYRQASDWGFDPQPGLALLRLTQGDSDTAVASINRCVQEADGAIERMRLLPALVEVLLAAGDVEGAAAAATELAQHSSVYGTDALEAQERFALGAVGLARGEAGQSLVDLRRACDIWLSLNVPYEVARTRVLIARACELLGDEETASLERAAAARQFDELGVLDPTHVDEFDASHGLTARELEVLGLLATGATNQSIAHELYVAVRTVDRHVSNILTKLGVSSRTAAVSWAYQHDLI